uniref:Ionotropic receptor 6 n=1 Tax=Meteorus pulchricornis TaxID=51522 RepID=A0A1S5VFV7_9HYME|nr:ionotropic receptor 6 [Meteorus pulchricornis]
MKFHYVIMVLGGIVSVKSTTKIWKKNDNSIERTNSLSLLSHHVVDTYFHGCAVIAIHDDIVFKRHPGLLRNIFRNSPGVTFVQQHLNITRTEPPLRFRDKCYHFMIFLDNIYDLSKIIREESVNKVLVISESTPWTVKEYLKSFPSRSYVNLLVITHSMSQRTGEGSYLLYTHELFTDGSGTSLPVLLTSWIGNRTTHENIDLFPEKLSGGFKGHRLVVATAHKPPFAIRTDIVAKRSSEWDGIDIRIIHLLSKTLNFTADFRDPTAIDSPIYAVTTDVLNGQASAAVGGIYRTTNITSKLDTTFSHMEDCAAFISLSSLALPKYRAVMGPFKPAVWILICLAYFVAIIPLSMNTNYTLWSLIIHPSRFLDMFWYVFSTFTNSFVVENPLLDTGLAKNSTSLLIGIYWVFTIIITSCYTGSIMAFITVPMFPQAIETAEQLLDEGYDIGTLDHDGWEIWFNWTTIDDKVAVELLKSIEYVPTVKEGVKNASSAFFFSYAFLGSKIVLDYIVQDEFTPSWSNLRSTMHVSQECFINFGVTFVLQKNSIYTEPFNSVIHRIRESGLGDKIIRDVEWDIQRTADGQRLPISDDYKRRKVVIEDRKLALDDTQGMFLVLGAGVLIAALALTIECCVKVYKEKFSGIITDAHTSVTSDATVPPMDYLKVYDPRNSEGSDTGMRRYNRFSI